MNFKILRRIVIFSCLIFIAFTFLKGCFKPLFVENYDSGRIQKSWDTHGLCCSHSLKLVTQPTRSGPYAAKFTLKYNDPPVYSGRRAEIVSWRLDEVGNILGDDEWFGFSVMLPTEFGKTPKNEHILFQWHGRPDKGELSRNPPLSLSAANNHWDVILTTNPKEIQTNPTPNPPRKTILSIPYNNNVWTDWVFHIKWDYRAPKDGGKGFVQIWQREEGQVWKKVADYQGPTGYNDQSNIDFQWGNYGNTLNASTTPLRIVYNDELRIAESGHFLWRFHQVAPKMRVKRNRQNE